MVQSLNTSILNTNNERAGTSTRSTTGNTLQQVLVIVCDHDTNDQCSKDIESKQSVDKTVGSLRDIAAGRGSLSCSGGDQLR
jgi:hypothetical protein